MQNKPKLNVGDQLIKLAALALVLYGFYILFLRK